MEDSTSSYDLLYLTNHSDFKRVKNKVCEPNLKEDVKFYRERIIQQTMDLLDNKDVTPQISNCFKNYLFLTVEHFKFKDKSEIIQKEYENIKKKKERQRPFNLKNTNKMLEKKEQKIGKITDSLPIKINHTKEKKIVYPKKKVINLKDEKFKTKGLEKKECDPIVVENNAKKNTKEKSKEESSKKNASKKKTEKKKKKKKKDITAKIYC
tara:strand:+ start:44 stop:670 length:627 start_codon:yes stop_codon:yes gene_type:complete